MALSRRQKVVLAALLLYWPAIFIGTHIPMPRIPVWAGQIPLSDKVMHFIAYLFLSFLLWLAINPDRKVHWRKPAVWWVLFIVVWYGVIDEWLQMYVGRDTDVRDFFADLAGAITGLLILTFVHFWAASLVITGGAIFAVTIILRSQPPVQGLRIDLFICGFAYLFFTLLWLRFIHHFLPVKPPQGKWLFGAIAMPMGFMAIVELFSTFTENSISTVWLLVATSAILASIIPFFVFGLLRNKINTHAVSQAY
ncbi:MAG: VanZ family protein [Phycisphaerae bacterium]